MNLISLGVPVVSPADPKIRTQDHLVDGFAFNYSIDPPSLWKMYNDYADELLDFLQVTELFVQQPNKGQFTFSETANLLNRYPDRSLVNIPNRWTEGEVELERVEVLHRRKFSAFVLPRSIVTNVERCPHLKRMCDLLLVSTRLETSSQPKLVRCRKKCLWQFDAPNVRPEDALLLPITYDSTLVVRGETEGLLQTIDVGGFLAVYSEGGLKPTRLNIDLDPDIRMVSRVAMSYLSLLTFVLLVIPQILSRRTLCRLQRS